MKVGIVGMPNAGKSSLFTALTGVAAERVVRWDRGVDASRFGPHLRGGRTLAGEVRVLYAGRISTEKGADLLADAFSRARDAHVIAACRSR